MKYVQTIWRLNSSRCTADREAWLEFLVATVEADFPISCSFVVLPEQHQQVLNWVQAKAVGPYSIQELPDGGITVALGARQDVVQIRAFHYQSLDQSVIVANCSEEQARVFIRQMKSRLAS